MEKELILAKNALTSLNGRSKEDILRFNLFSIMTTVLLSKFYFKKNSEIELFLKEINIEYKPYVYKSRTLLVARVNRHVEKSSIDELQKLLKITKELMFDSTTIYQKKEKNDLDEILSQFKRR